MRFFWLQLWIDRCLVCVKAGILTLPRVALPADFLQAASLCLVEASDPGGEVLMLIARVKFNLAGCWWNTFWTRSSPWSAFNTGEEIFPSHNHGDVNSLSRLVAQRKTAAWVCIGEGRKLQLRAFSCDREHRQWLCRESRTQKKRPTRAVGGDMPLFSSRYARSMFIHCGASAAIRPSSFGCPRPPFV